MRVCAMLSCYPSGPIRVERRVCERRGLSRHRLRVFLPPMRARDPAVEDLNAERPARPREEGVPPKRYKAKGARGRRSVMKHFLACVVAAAAAAVAAALCPYQSISTRHTICMYRTAACPGKALISEYPQTTTHTCRYEKLWQQIETIKDQNSLNSNSLIRNC